MLEHIKATAFTQDLNGSRRVMALLDSLGGCCLEGFKSIKLYLKTMLLKNKQQQTNAMPQKGRPWISLQPFGNIMPRGSSNGSVGLGWAGVELNSKQQNLDRLGMQLEGRWGKDRMHFLFVCPAV